MELSGARILCESLLREGVETMFGLPGGVTIPLYDVFPDYPIRHVLVRHEQNAAHAADGYARARDTVGVCLATSGPGATNLVTGLASAFMDSVPVVAITGQVTTKFIGSDAFQETDTVGITQPITKHNYLVKTPADLARTVKEAFHIARTGRPGPVLIDIPKDVFLNKAEFVYPDTVDLPGYKPTYQGHVRQIKEAAALIARAQKPLIIVGHGAVISGAYAELRQLAETAHIPVLNTLLGISAFPQSHPLNYGFLGMHGWVHANRAVDECDVLIGIGMRFDDRVTGKLSAFAPNAKVIHIEIDPAEIGKNVPATVPIVGDCRLVLQELNKHIQPAGHADWIERIESWRSPRVQEAYFLNRQTISPAHPVEEIYKQTPAPIIVTTDVGQHQMWAAQFFNRDERNSWISSGGLGAMGFGVPSAMGAKLARPEATVWAICGDGGFQMSIPELSTLVQENINIKVCVLNNGHLGMVRQWQDLFHKKNYVATPIHSPDFVKLGEAYGIMALCVRDPGDVAGAVAAALAHQGPVIIDFQVAQEENVYPMIPSGQSIKEMIESEEARMATV
ncbi:MAG TPA: biosynthetic-type acetolactate synthase large subunit [Chloroflexota bacterium]|nr:biosynthetic-type acetolactate synthase large subunit [Chloroflexota bacterium]